MYSLKPLKRIKTNARLSIKIEVRKVGLEMMREFRDVCNVPSVCWQRVPNRWTSHWKLQVKSLITKWRFKWSWCNLPEGIVKPVHKGHCFPAPVPQLQLRYWAVRRSDFVTWRQYASWRYAVGCSTHNCAARSRELAFCASSSTAATLSTAAP